VRRSSFSFSGTKARAFLAAAAAVASTMAHRVPAEPPSASRFAELLGKEDVTGEQILREMNSRKAILWTPSAIKMFIYQVLLPGPPTVSLTTLLTMQQEMLPEVLRLRKTTSWL
jgi:hypothetical protein